MLGFPPAVAAVEAREVDVPLATGAWQRLRLTKNRPLPRTGVGQKSSAGELTGSPRFCGAPQGASVLGRRATQMSSPPTPPGRLEAMYSLRSSGDWMGQPSSDGVFSSALFPPISSISCAWLYTEARVAPAGAAIKRPRRPRRTHAAVHAFRICCVMPSPS